MTTKKLKLIPVFFDEKAVEFVKNRNAFAKLYKKTTGKTMRVLFGRKEE